MARHKIRYLPVAERDLLQILEYVKRDRPDAALSLLARFDTSIAQLAEFPLVGKVPRDRYLQRRGYRILIVDNYLVFYTVMPDCVEIRRIIHGKRRYEFLL